MHQYQLHHAGRGELKELPELAMRTLRIMAESSSAAPMFDGGEEPQPNSDIHSRFPVGFTSLRSCARWVPKYCSAHKDVLTASYSCTSHAPGKQMPPDKYYKGRVVLLYPSHLSMQTFVSGTPSDWQRQGHPWAQMGSWAGQRACLEGGCKLAAARSTEQEEVAAHRVDIVLREGLLGG